MSQQKEESSSESQHDPGAFDEYYHTKEAPSLPAAATATTKKNKRADDTLNDVEFAALYEKEGYLDEDRVMGRRDLRMGAEFVKLGATGNDASATISHIKITLGKKSLSRKKQRQYIETDIPLKLYRYRSGRWRNKLSYDGQVAFARGTVPESNVELEHFAKDIDYYSKIHGEFVLGFDLLDVLTALSVSETKTATKRERFEVRSSQILRAPLRIYPMDFFHFYPCVSLVNDNDSSRLTEEDVFGQISDEEIDIANSENNGNNSSRIRRSTTDNRIIPCYLLPLFLSTQSALIAQVNPATVISHKLLDKLRSCRHLFAAIGKVIDHAIIQLNANHLISLHQDAQSAILCRDLYSKGSHLRDLYDQLMDRLKAYDYELYERVMFDRGVTATIKMNMNTPTIQMNNGLPVLDMSFERSSELFEIFDRFCERYEQTHHFALETSDRQRSRYRNALFDTMVRHLVYAQVTGRFELDLIEQFCEYMKSTTDPLSEMAKAYFKDLNYAYNKRLNQVSQAQFDTDAQNALMSEIIETTKANNEAMQKKMGIQVIDPTQRQSVKSPEAKQKPKKVRQPAKAKKTPESMFENLSAESDVEEEEEKKVKKHRDSSSTPEKKNKKKRKREERSSSSSSSSSSSESSKPPKKKKKKKQHKKHAVSSDDEESSSRHEKKTQKEKKKTKKVAAVSSIAMSSSDED